MYKILLADNEGVVLDSLIQLINGRLGESCDIRTAQTARYARILARKFMPDIVVINVQMPGMHGFDVVREIRSYHIRCVFLTVSSYKRASFRSEAESLHILAHLVKPLSREKILPVLDEAVRVVSRIHRTQEQNQHIQEKFDQAVPLLEQGLISQFFFPESAAENLAQYTAFLNIPQTCGRLVSLVFGEAPNGSGQGARAQNTQDAPDGGLSEDALQNLIGSSVRLQRDYKKFREVLREHFPLALAGPVMGNHILFLLPCWREETAREEAEFSRSLAQLLEALEDAFENLTFLSSYSPVGPLSRLRPPVSKI